MSSQEALEAALTAYFAARRLRDLTGTLAHTSVLPSALLWIHTWWPLPNLLREAAVVGWAVLLSLALASSVACWRWRLRLGCALPDAQRAVRVQALLLEPALGLSSYWFLFSVATSAALWVHGLYPGLLSGTALGLADRIWAVLIVAAIANRALESY